MDLRMSETAYERETQHVCAFACRCMKKRENLCVCERERVYVRKRERESNTPVVYVMRPEKKLKILT